MTEGYEEAVLLDAVRGVVNDPWPDRVLHNDLTIVLRDGEHVEKFAGFFHDPPRPLVKPLTQNPNDRRIAEFGRGLNAIEGMPA